MSRKDDENAARGLLLFILLGIICALIEFAAHHWVEIATAVVALVLGVAVYKHEKRRKASEDAAFAMQRARSAARAKSKRLALAEAKENERQAIEQATKLEKVERNIYLERYSVVKAFPCISASVIVRHDRISLVCTRQGPDRRYNDTTVITSGEELKQSMLDVILAKDRAAALVDDVVAGATAIESYSNYVRASACHGRGFVTFYDTQFELESGALEKVVAAAKSLLENYDDLMAQASEAALRPYLAQHDKNKAGQCGCAVAPVSNTDCQIFPSITDLSHEGLIRVDIP